VSLADRFDGFLIDLDGVVWIGREPVPGSPETLRTLLEAGKRLVFVTNNPGKPPAVYAKRLLELGVRVYSGQIVTAGMVVTRLAAKAAGDEGSAFVIGAPALREMAAATGMRLLKREEAREADVVIVSGHREFDYRELLAAKQALDRGAALFATSRDPTMPFPGGEVPGTGAVLAAVETASGRRAEIAGKPEPHLFEMAIEAVGSGRLAMVGDRVSSDVAGGRAAGLETILVLSGTTSREEATDAHPAPDFVVDSLSGLLA
jgi:glycerol 3-phosphatase-2